MRFYSILTTVLCWGFAAAPAVAQEEVEGDEQELALRQDAWTHLVVTLRNGKKVTYARGEIAKVQYVTQRAQGATSSGGGANWMGRVWKVREQAADGRYCTATWTRAGTSNRLDGNWVCSWGARVHDWLVVQPLSGRAVKVYREGLRKYYHGTLATDGRHISGPGFAESAGNGWTVTIE
jgi:hypothetical protein